MRDKKENPYADYYTAEGVLTEGYQIGWELIEVTYKTEYVSRSIQEETDTYSTRTRFVDGETPVRTPVFLFGKRRDTLLEQLYNRVADAERGRAEYRDGMVRAEQDAATMKKQCATLKGELDAAKETGTVLRDRLDHMRDQFETAVGELNKLREAFGARACDEVLGKGEA